MQTTPYGPQVGESVLNHSYILIAQVKASVGGKRILLGKKGVCRYCGTGDVSKFRNVAHTFPESLGNKWVRSLDECDECNKRFSVYDEALANSVSPFLTLGGVKGKANKVRQTGRSDGDAVLSRQPTPSRSRILIRARGTDATKNMEVDPITGKVTLNFPIAGVPFRPRHAYKALVKMALAIMPDEELHHFQKLLGWINDVNDEHYFPHLEVGMSFASVGNSPQLAAAVLLRRANPLGLLPYMLFIFTAGSVCLQIYLMPDCLDDHLPLFGPNVLKIQWSSVIVGDDAQAPIQLSFGAPIALNWAPTDLRPQPVESITLTV